MRRDLLLLHEMRDAVVAIHEIVEGRTANQIDADPLRRSALLWHFTVLGEAASQVPTEIKDVCPAIAWRAAARLRNRIVHGYWSIDVHLLVSTATDDLPQMLPHLDHAIATLETIDTELT